MKTVLKTLPLAIFLSACSFIPTYETPEVDLSSAWVEMSLAEKHGENIQALGWREFFRDGQLQSLIETALAHNHDLHRAALNVQIAAEQHQITQSNQLPTVGMTAGGTRTRTGASASRTGSAVYGHSYNLGVGISSFELDFFGRVSALSEAALQQYLQTQEARDAAQLSVMKAVAQSYYRARISKALMDLSERVLTARQDTAKLAKMQFDVGLISGVTLHSYENAIESARADFYGYQRNHQQALNALSVLVGLPLERLTLPTEMPLSAQFAAIQMPEGIPSALLQQRPDVRQAEFALKAANANIGAARAALFPSISLTGSAGYVSYELNQLVQGPSSVWSIAPSITLPIFNRGKLYSNVRVSELSQQLAVENYQSTVKTAFQEVADALVARETYAKQFAASQSAVEAQNEVLRLEKMRFEAGVSDGLKLIDAERNSFIAQQALLSVQLNLLNNMVALYTAMGGGLQEYGVAMPAFEGQTPVPSKALEASVENSPQNVSAATAAVPAGAVRIKL